VLLKENWGVMLFLFLGSLGLLLLGLLSPDFENLGWQAWYVLIVLLVTLAFLIKDHLPVHVIMLGCLLLQLIPGIIKPADALEGFGDSSIATIAVLFITAEGISRTSVLLPIFRYILGRPKRLWPALVRLTVPVAIASGFLNNTPIVAMMIPVVQQFSRRTGIPVSKLLMPMNNATVMGGTFTILGTSTNLVVVALARKYLPDVEIGIFGPTRVAAPVVLVGLTYLVIAAPLFLRDRSEALTRIIQNPREYTVALTVEERSPIVASTVVEAGLRHLKGLFLIEITRSDGEVIPAVAPETRIHAGDILLFAGVVETVKDLYQIPGLVPATAQTNKIRLERHRRTLVEVVISPSSNMVGQSVVETRFRSKYNAAIIAVHRGGQHVRERIGDIILRGGDTLLLEATPDFVRRFSVSSNFALVSEVVGSAPPRYDIPHMIIAVVLVVAMIAVATSGKASLLTTAGTAAFLMIITRCMTMEQAGRAFNVPIMVALAASFALSSGLEQTGAAQAFADFLVGLCKRGGRFALIFAIYFATMLLSELLSNTAAVTLMFPIVADPDTGIAFTQNLNIYAALYAMMLAASLCFSTPVGYQTNLMVHGPGGYTFMDWVRFGVVLDIICLFMSVTMLYFLFP